MKKCTCGKVLASNARFCPNCGHRFTHPLVKVTAIMFGVFFGLSIFGAIIAAVVGTNKSETLPQTASQQTQEASEKAKYDKLL